MKTVIDIETPIETILLESVEEAKEREQRRLQELLNINNGRVVIVGAGNTGKRTFKCLRSIGIEPLVIADNDSTLYGTEIEGTPVIALTDAGKHYGKDALFIVAIWNAKHWYAETAAQLTEAGCLTIVPIGPVYWRFRETFLPFFVQDLPHKVFAERSAVLRASQLWSDEESKLEYLAHVRWRTHGDAGGLPKRSPHESYFANDIFDLSADEALVDCGAYDGDTIRSFLARRGNEFKHVDAIEPSPGTFARLERYISTLPSKVRHKIKLHQCALGNSSGSVRFDATRGVDSQISSEGQITVDLRTLDDLSGETSPTYLKMDIEGAEFEALLGADRLIRKCRPILAICLEHYQNDLWRLPLLIHDNVPDYSMYLRTYEGDGWQSVCYAVPPNRCREPKCVLTER